MYQPILLLSYNGSKCKLSLNKNNVNWTCMCQYKNIIGLTQFEFAI